MNQAEKEEYLREYGILKSEGKPFFPYAIAKDSLMAVIVIAVIIAASLVLGVQMGAKVNAATSSYDPRPDWYFLFLFEILRQLPVPDLVGLATIGIPTLCMILLFLLPFYDRSPERRPERRPVATFSAIFVMGAMLFLTINGAEAGTPYQLIFKTPSSVIKAGPAAVAKFEGGRLAIAESGCEACHTIGSNGNPGPGPELTAIGARIPAKGIAKTLVNPTYPMPSFKRLPPKKFEAIVYFLSQLK